MRTIFLCLIFSFATNFSFAQNKILIDSLLKEVQKAKNDSVRSYLYKEISNEFWSQAPEQCEKYASLALKYAQKTKSHGLISECCQTLGSASYFLGKNMEALKYSRYAYNEAVLSKDEELIMSAGLNLGTDYFSNAQYDSSLVVLKQGIRIAEKIKNKDRLGMLYMNMGNVYFAKLKYDTSEIFYQKGLDIALTLKDTQSMAQLYNNIASLRLNRGISDSIVIKYLMNAIKINEKSKEYLNLGSNFTTLALAYNLKNNKEKIVFYLKKGIKAFEKAGNDLQAIPAIVSLADQYRELNKLDSALIYADKAIAIGKKNNYINGLAGAYVIKGLVASHKSDYKSAGIYLNDAYKEFKSLGNGEGIFLAGNALTHVLEKQNKIREAIVIAENIYTLADSIKNFNQIQISSLALAELNHKSGNHAAAYDYLKKHMIASDTINKMHQASLLDELEAKYQASKKDLEIVNLKNEKLVREKRMIQLLYLFGLFAIVSAALFYIFSKRQKYKKEKSELLLKQQLAEVRQEALNAQINAHFVSRSMDSINQFIQNNEKEKAGEYLLLFNRLIRKVLENSFKKAIPIHDDIEILNDYIKLEKVRFIDGKLGFNVKIDEELDSRSTLIPPMVFQTLIENSIIHGFSKSTGGEIHLMINKINETLECILEDNGIGHKKSLELRPDKETGRISLGSKLAKKIVLLFNEAGIENEFRILDSMIFPTGTRVEFVLPLISTE